MQKVRRKRQLLMSITLKLMQKCANFKSAITEAGTV